MKHRRCKLSGDLVHVWDHQQQTLRCREGRSKRACLKCAMYRAGGTTLALHLHHYRYVAPDIFSTLGGPLVSQLTHGRGRCDRVDGADFVGSIGDVGSSLVAVESYLLSVHEYVSRH